jgi:chromosome segregation ATPase
MRLAEAEAELGSMRAKLADREGLAGEKRRLLDELQVCKAEVTDLTAEVGRLKGYKDKLAQAGDLRRQLQEKEEESESLIEQLAEKEAEANEHQRQAEDLRKEVLDAKKSLQACQQLLQGLSAPAAGGEAGEGAAGGDEGERRYQLVLSQLQDAQSELRGVKSELERARRELQDFAAQGDAHDDVAGEGASRVDESVEGLGARGKEQDLKKQNARLTVEVRALQAKLASAAGAGGGGRSEELQAALAELKVFAPLSALAFARCLAP